MIDLRNSADAVTTSSQVVKLVPSFTRSSYNSFVCVYDVSAVHCKSIKIQRKQLIFIINTSVHDSNSSIFQRILSTTMIISRRNFFRDLTRFLSFYSLFTPIFTTFPSPTNLILYPKVQTNFTKVLKMFKQFPVKYTSKMPYLFPPIFIVLYSSFTRIEHTSLEIFSTTKKTVHRYQFQPARSYTGTQAGRAAQEIVLEFPKGEERKISRVERPRRIALSFLFFFLLPTRTNGQSMRFSLSS